VAEWRFGFGWTDKELTKRLDTARKLDLNFPRSGPESQEGKNWRRYYSESIIGRENPGRPVPGGGFEIAWKAITEYQFSDPGIVKGHFDPNDEVEGRTMLLELKVVGLRYLVGVRVTAVRKHEHDDRTQWSFRYDTLQDHIEVGSEWFTLTKKHDSGEIWFRISASWRPGEFPNWWSRVGFEVVGRKYQLAWHRLAYVRLRELVSQGGRDLIPLPYGEKLVHTGAEIEDSELWLLKIPSATARVQQAGKENSQCPDSESETSSSSPGHRPA
jgi:uncharacterized protein (UPF0548 family)